MKQINSLLAIVFVALLTVSAAPRRQSTIAKGLKPAETVVPTSGIDSVVAPGRSLITVDGYQKVLRAYRESMFVVNHTSDTLVGLRLDITYTTPAGVQLHRRQKTVECIVPPGERRNITIPSWDTQRQFYYIGSPRPKRAKGSPYAADIKVAAAYFSKH